jgi:diguanylate cyclase (GGDEF)-like protein
LSSLVAEQQQRRGLSRLRFAKPFVEDEFRQHYGAIHHTRVRGLLVVASFAVVAITGTGIAQHTVSALTATFGLAVMMPLLMGTLIASFQRDRHRLYQHLLSLSALCTGLIVTSLTLRASLHGTPYYFGAQVAWILTVWLILGLVFWSAAVTTFIISATYAWGLLHWNFGPQEALFESAMLVGVNVIGAVSCFQLEDLSRLSFVESRRLNDLAERDGLTGLYNRRAYNNFMDRIWRQSRREQSQLTIMLIDIDHFKAFNDLYGHQAGDDALKRVAETIAMGAQRPLDFAARYGGEEFALVLYGLADGHSRELPEQIRQRVERLAVPHAESSAGAHLTVSIGVSIVTPGAERSLAGAIQMADEALYQAKEEGRNRVVVKESQLTEIETGKFRSARRAAAG